MNAKVYLIYGSDEFHVSLRTKELLDKLVPAADRAFGLETFDGRADAADDAVKAIKGFMGSILTASFLGPGKTVLVQNINFLGEDRRLSETIAVKEALEGVPEELAKIPEGHRLILSGAGISGLSRIVKAVATMAKTGAAVVEKYEAAGSWGADAAAGDFILKEAARLGHAIAPEVADALRQRVGNDYRMLSCEIEKLFVYVGDREPTAEDVSVISAPMRTSEFWDLPAAFGRRDLGEMLAVARRLMDSGVDPVGLVIPLIRHVNEALLAQDSMRRGYLAASRGSGFEWCAGAMPPAAAKAAADLGEGDAWNLPKKSGFAARNLAPEAGRFTRMELRFARHTLMQAYERMVSSPSDGESLLELALIRLSGKKTQ